MIERVFAGLVLAACAVMLLRLVIGERRRYRFDAALRGAWLTLRRAASSVRGRRASKRDAQRAAQEAIRRASRRSDWEGNVNTPKSFRKPPRDKMH